MQNEELESCCSEWEHAMSKGTDSEGYGPLICFYTHIRAYRMGMSLKPIRFCPWCGDLKPFGLKES